MRLYAVVIGKAPKYKPYVAYRDRHYGQEERSLAVFDTRKEADKCRKAFGTGYIVRFESVNQ